MYRRLVKFIRERLLSEEASDSGVDVCVECGAPSFPGARRCSDCLG